MPLWYRVRTFGIVAAKDSNTGVIGTYRDPFTLKDVRFKHSDQLSTRAMGVKSIGPPPKTESAPRSESENELTIHRQGLKAGN